MALSSDAILLAVGRDLRARHPERYEAERLRELKRDRARQRRAALERDSRQTLPELIASARALGELIWGTR